jgi:hypothetical protein
MSHSVEVLLVVASPEPGKKSGARLLLLEEDGVLSLPRQLLGDETTFELAARLLAKTTGLKAKVMGKGWVDLVAAPLADATDRLTNGERTIGVPYGALLPGEVAELSDPRARWVSVGELFDKTFEADHLDIIQAVTPRL